MENEEVKTKETGNKEAEVKETEQKAEKMFTQEQVNDIIRNRLKEQKEANATAEQLNARESELSAKESRLSCREYLLEKGYPEKLLDIIDTSDVEAFKSKADSASQMFGGGSRMRRIPLASTEDSLPDDAALAFAGNQKHVPKKFPPIWKD